MSLKLNNEQKKIFVDTLIYLSHLDGHLDEGEVAFIKNYDLEQPNDIHDPLSEEEILEGLAKLKDRRVCLELIKELCRLGHADSNLSEEEVLFIGHAGLKMGIEIEKIEQISDWVVDQLILDEKRKIIFEEC